MRLWKAVLAAVTLLVLLTGVVYAAWSYTAEVATTVNVAVGPADVGLTVTPETVTLDTTAGETSVVMMTVENVGTDTLSGVVFEAKRAPDGWIFMGTGGWGTLAPGETTEMQIWITVPPVASGGYGFALLFHGVR
jgi:uncharacterized membrane protein